jgi:hypothetical protein
MVLYMSFYIFLKNSNFRSTFIGLSLRFYQKFPVCGKNGPKLYISVSWPPYSRLVVPIGLVYEILCVFKKIKFSLKTIGFYRKFPVCSENGPKLRIYWSWLSYSGLVVPNGLAYEFLWVKKNSSKSTGVSLRFYQNSQFAAKMDQNSVFQWRDPHILDWKYQIVPYMSFYVF